VSDLSALGDSMLAIKRWDTGSETYVWSGTPATDGFSNIMFVGPQDPAVAAGGRNINGDIWVDTGVPA